MKQTNINISVRYYSNNYRSYVLCGSLTRATDRVLASLTLPTQVCTSKSRYLLLNLNGSTKILISTSCDERLKTRRMTQTLLIVPKTGIARFCICTIVLAKKHQDFDLQRIYSNWTTYPLKLTSTHEKPRVTLACRSLHLEEVLNRFSRKVAVFLYAHWEVTEAVLPKISGQTAISVCIDEIGCFPTEPILQVTIS